MKQKFLVAGFVVALIVGGISLDALASSGKGSSDGKQGVLVAAKKKVKKSKKAKKAKKQKARKSTEVGAPGAATPGGSSAPVPEGVFVHDADFTLKCPGKDIVLQFVDNSERVKDNEWQFYDKRTTCVELFLDEWQKQARAEKTFPMDFMKKLYGVSATPVETPDTKFSEGRYKLWKFFLSGDAILKPLGDKFAPANEEIRLDGVKCYTAPLSDYRGDKDREGTDQWSVGTWSAIYNVKPPDCLPKI